MLPEPALATPSTDAVSPWGSPQQRAKQRRNKYDALLATAAAAFKQQGFAAASLDHMAAQLGITKPTLYYYVPSKAQLVQSCALQGFAQALAGMQRAKALQPALKAYAQVVASDFGWCMVRAQEYALPDALAQVLRQQRKALELALHPWLPAGMQAAVLLRAVEGVALHLPMSQVQSLLAYLPLNQLSTLEKVEDGKSEGEVPAVSKKSVPAITAPVPALAPALETVPEKLAVSKPTSAPKPAPPRKQTPASTPSRSKARKTLEQISLF